MKKQVELREIQKVALLLRVSTEDQVSGNSLTTQENLLRDWAARENWNVAEVYEEPGKSAFRKVQGRDVFLRMIEDAEALRFDAVLVLKGDRFMRGVGSSAIYRDRLFAAGVHYKSYEEPGAWDGSLGGFLQGSLADTFAEYYSLDLSLKMTRNLLTRAEKGLTLGDVPFGYTRDDPRQPVYPKPMEAAVVLMIFEFYGTGLYSMDQLANELNSRGFRPRSKQDKLRFSKASVQGMLTNPVYAGYVTRHGEILGDGLHEPIVSRELFELVQRVLAQRARKPRAYSSQPAFPYLLSGIGFCASCGGPLWANSAGGGRYHYYRCAAGPRGEICNDDGISTRIDGPDDSLGRMIARMRLPPAWRQRVCELIHQDAEPDAVDAQRRYWQAQAKRAKDGFKAQLLDTAEAAAMNREAEDRLRELESQRPSATVEVAPILTDMCEAWPRFTPEERREAVRIMLADVRIDVRRGDVTGIRPADSFAPLFQTVAESGGAVGFCDWRPRADSNSP